MAQIKAKQIQVSAVGDLIIGASTVSGFSGSILSIGAANQILTSNGTTAAWGYLGTLRDTTGDAIVTVADITGPVNTLEIAAGVSSVGPTLTAIGSDTNIDINLTTKGSGEVLVPVTYMANSPNALITKAEVDAIATGLDFKNSVRAATCFASDLTGFTYSSAADDNSTATPLVWTGAGSAVFDGITLADGDRVIIKNSPDPRGNGIFTFDAGSGFRRADDADNSPSNEVSGGMFAFVEEGTEKADTGWVVSSPDGLVTLGTDDIIWTQFSAAGIVTPGNGLEQIGTVLNVTVDDVTVYIDGGNDVAVKSSATANQVLLSDGTSTTPSWGALPLGDSNAVTGILLEANGGTGESTYAEGDLLVGDAGSGLTKLSVVDGAGTQVLSYNDATDTVEWTSASNIGGNAFGVVTGDTGTANADSTSDTIAITGGIGISTTAVDSPDSLTVEFNRTGMADTAVVLTDTFPFFDGSNSNEPEFRSFEDVFNDLNVAFDITGTGIVIKTGEGPDTYAAKSVEASTVNGEEGIVVTNGDGVASGDIVIGVDIVGQTAQTTVDGANDLVLLYDASAGENFKVTIDDLVAGAGTVTETFKTFNADTGSAIADNATDTISITGGIGISTTAQDSPDAITFEFDNSGMADTPIQLTDTFPFFDGSNSDEAEFRSFSDLITDIGLATDAFTTIVGDTGTNPVANGSSDTLTLTGGEGIATVGDLSTDTITIDLNIPELTSETVIDSTNDQFVFYDNSASAHRKTTLDDILDSINIGEVGEDLVTAVSTSSVFASFFTNTPISDDHITVFFNGLALDNSAWTRSGTTLTLIPATIGYGVETGDDIKARYEF